MIAKATPGGFEPLQEYWDEYEEKCIMGQEYLIEPKQPRNLGYHRKYFALLNATHKQCDAEYTHSLDAYREDVIIAAGYFTMKVLKIKEYLMTEDGEHLTRNGKKIIRVEERHIKKAKSIKFANMSQGKFEELYSKSVDAIIREFLPQNTTPEDVHLLVSQFC